MPRGWLLVLFPLFYSQGAIAQELIKIKGFVLKGNTVFSDAEILTAAAPLIGREVSFSDLLDLEARITQKYVEAGYINSGAKIPAGQILSPKDAVITIEIIEGGLEEITVTGLRRLDPNYVRSRLAVAGASPLNQNRLLEGLQLLRLDPLISSVTAELSPGPNPNLSRLDVVVTESEPFELKVNVDNGRSPAVGSVRRGVTFGYQNLSGIGDKLSANYVNTDGSNAFSFNYLVPVNPLNGTLSLEYDRTSSTVIEPPFDRLSILGESPTYRITYRQPVYQTPLQELALGLTASYQASQSTLGGEPFQLAPGADPGGNTRIAAIRFFQDYLTRGRLEVFQARSQFSYGVGLLGATINPDPPDSRFLAWRFQGQYVRSLGADSLWVTRVDTQLANRPLVPQEQFAVGGFRSVRGYRQDTILADSGFFLSTEVQIPIARFSPQDVLQVIPFADFGTTWSAGATPGLAARNGTLYSLGLGLQFRLGDRLTTRLDVGVPLNLTDAAGNALGTNNILFSLEYRAF
ncbi:MAG: ShlB/FhaC/HecB family hemolysin secretion/activation protein [Pseudanabaenaceae cyanobacterium SKYGB_i_bin29]|nr:BamA/TamA family outer membrane protein [Pseudanabaenaceae cyanobacterium SKYG29]MDW8421650.1 ShlB/FhaC/HecB family hemolysin secretion/activation protein [Pseudanabaenaceae cyanobacterium SKYGB_i_bin29]